MDVGVKNSLRLLGFGLGTAGAGKHGGLAWIFRVLYRLISVEYGSTKNESTIAYYHIGGFRNPPECEPKLSALHICVPISLIASFPSYDGVNATNGVIRY